MKSTVCINLMATLLLLGAGHVMSAEAPSPGAAQLAMANLPAKAGARLSVESPAFKTGGDIPYENTQYRGNIFPGLSWSAGPAGTRSYVIIMQDPDSLHDGMPILHWTMFNIPASVTRLDAAMTAPPAGSSYGPNIRGTNQAYMGPAHAARAKASLPPAAVCPRHRPRRRRRRRLCCAHRRDERACSC